MCLVVATDAPADPSVTPRASAAISALSVPEFPVEPSDASAAIAALPVPKSPEEPSEQHAFLNAAFEWATQHPVVGDEEEVSGVAEVYSPEPSTETSSPQHDDPSAGGMGIPILTATSPAGTAMGTAEDVAFGSPLVDAPAPTGQAPAGITSPVSDILAHPAADFPGLSGGLSSSAVSPPLAAGGFHAPDGTPAGVPPSPSSAIPSPTSGHRIISQLLR